MVAHFTGEPFIITQRHYDTIIDQANKNLPKETGGFLGGHGRYIKGILPLFNSFLGDKTKTFGYMPEDAIRAREFFEKHKLEYLGVYHTHPVGSADPSVQDLMHIQKYMFIISMSRPSHPDFACYEVQGKLYNRVGLEIESNNFDVIDIHAKSTGNTSSTTHSSKLQTSPPKLEGPSAQKQVDGLFDAIIKEEGQVYQKFNLRTDEDDDEEGLSFSTFA